MAIDALTNWKEKLLRDVSGAIKYASAYANYMDSSPRRNDPPTKQGLEQSIKLVASDIVSLKLILTENKIDPQQIENIIKELTNINLKAWRPDGGKGIQVKIARFLQTYIDPLIRGY